MFASVICIFINVKELLNFIFVHTHSKIRNEQLKIDAFRTITTQHLHWINCDSEFCEPFGACFSFPLIYENVFLAGWFCFVCCVFFIFCVRWYFCSKLCSCCALELWISYTVSWLWQLKWWLIFRPFNRFWCANVVSLNAHTQNNGTVSRCFALNLKFPTNVRTYNPSLFFSLTRIFRMLRTITKNAMTSTQI